LKQSVSPKERAMGILPEARGTSIVVASALLSSMQIRSRFDNVSLGAIMPQASTPQMAHFIETSVVAVPGDGAVQKANEIRKCDGSHSPLPSSFGNTALLEARKRFSEDRSPKFESSPPSRRSCCHRATCDENGGDP